MKNPFKNSLKYLFTTASALAFTTGIAEISANQRVVVNPLPAGATLIDLDIGGHFTGGTFNAGDSIVMTNPAHNVLINRAINVLGIDLNQLEYEDDTGIDVRVTGVSLGSVANSQSGQMFLRVKNGLGVTLTGESEVAGGVVADNYEGISHVILGSDHVMAPNTSLTITSVGGNLNSPIFNATIDSYYDRANPNDTESYATGNFADLNIKNSYNFTKGLGNIVQLNNINISGGATATTEAGFHSNQVNISDSSTLRLNGGTYVGNIINGAVVGATADIVILGVNTLKGNIGSIAAPMTTTIFNNGGTLTIVSDGDGTTPAGADREIYSPISTDSPSDGTLKISTNNQAVQFYGIIGDVNKLGAIDTRESVRLSDIITFNNAVHVDNLNSS